MKKLKLKLAQLSSAEVLTREQLKNVLKSSVGGSICTCDIDACNGKQLGDPCYDAYGAREGVCYIGNCMACWIDTSHWCRS